MQLSAEAWRLREETRKAMGVGDYKVGFELASQAQAVQGTDTGEALRRLCEWLQAGGRNG